MQVWNVLHAPRWKYRTQKIAKKLPSAHHRTTFSGYIFAIKAHIDNRKKNFLSSNISFTCPDNMVNFGPLAAEIDPVIWGTLQISMGFASWQRYCTAVTYILCACNTVQLLRHSRLPFSWTMPPNSRKLSALITRFRELVIQQRECESWVKKTEGIMEGLVEFWQCTDTAFEWKMLFSCFPVLSRIVQKQKSFGVAQQTIF